MPHTAAVLPERAALTAVVEEMVGQGSFARLSYASVATRAGVTEETLRQVFPAKRDLVEAVCVERHHLWFLSLVDAVSQENDPRDQILEVFTFLEADDTGCCPCSTAVGTGQQVMSALASGHLLEVEHFMAALCAKAGFPKFLSDALVLLIEGAATSVRVKETAAPLRTARTAAAMLMSVYEPSDVF